MSRRLLCALSAAIGLLTFTIAVAASNHALAPTLPEIHSQQTELHADVVAGRGQFGDMSNVERAILVKQQEEVLNLIAGKQSLDDLNDKDKVRAFNLLESIKSTIVKNDDARIICERYKPVGSNRTERVCATVAERRQMQEVSADALNKRGLCNGIERCKYD